METPEDLICEDNPLLTKPQRRTKFTDTFWMVLFLLMFTTVVGISVSTFQNCISSRFFRGIDSWGNVCGGSVSTKTVVAGVNGSGQSKSENPYLWSMSFQTARDEKSLNCLRSAKNATFVKLCVKLCPGRMNITEESCRKVLNENSYDLEYAEKQCQNIAQSAHQTQNSDIRIVSLLPPPFSQNNTLFITRRMHINFIFSSNLSDVIIFSRCLPSEVVKSNYVIISSYLSVWHYAIYDVITCADVITSSVVLAMGACVLTCIFVIKYSKYAFVCCNATGLLVCTITTAMTTYRLFQVKVSEPLNLLNDAVLLYLLCVISSTYSFTVISVTIWNKRNDNRYARGFLSESSRCLQSLPKLLSQPLWTTFCTLISTFYCALLLTSVLNCGDLKGSEDLKTVVYFTSQSSLSSVYSSVVVIFYLWCVNIFTTGQKVVVTGAISLWYFNKERHRLLHPITSSLQMLLRYNIGSVFGGAIHSKFLYAVFSSCKKRNKVTSPDSICREEVPESSLSFLSPYCPASIGVYGYARPTCISEGQYGFYMNTNEAKLPTASRTPLRTRSLYSVKTESAGLPSTIRRSHAAARWCIRCCRMSIICAAMALCAGILEVKENALVKLFPFLVTMCAIYFSCDVCLSVLTAAIDTIAVCFSEDMARNNGVDRLYFGSRGLIYHITGTRLPEAATFGGVVRIGKKKRLQEKQRLKDEARKAREAEAMAKIKQPSDRKKFKIIREDITSSRCRNGVAENLNETENGNLSNSSHNEKESPQSSRSNLNKTELEKSNPKSEAERTLDDTATSARKTSDLEVPWTAVQVSENVGKSSDVSIASSTRSKRSIQSHQLEYPQSSSTTIASEDGPDTDQSSSSFIQFKGKSAFSKGIWNTLAIVAPSVVSSQNRPPRIIKTVRREEDCSEEEDEDNISQSKYEAKLWEDMTW
ncbi:uncharacterized protein LOC144747091 [Ciona intestinalis]